LVECAHADTEFLRASNDRDTDARSRMTEVGGYFTSTVMRWKVFSFPSPAVATRV
jgi:hypothetical protein